MYTEICAPRYARQLSAAYSRISILKTNFRSGADLSPPPPGQSRKTTNFLSCASSTHWPLSLLPGYRHVVKRKTPTTAVANAMIRPFIARCIVPNTHHPQKGKLKAGRQDSVQTPLTVTWSNKHHKKEDGQIVCPWMFLAQSRDGSHHTVALGGLRHIFPPFSLIEITSCQIYVSESRKFSNPKERHCCISTRKR